MQNMQSFDFNNDIAVHKHKVDEALNLFFKSVLADSIYTFNKQLLEAVAEFTLRGGKRLRPILVLKGFEAAGRNKDMATDAAMMEEATKASICIELMQSSFLIHDDIMDKSELRRNKPTLHRLLGENEAIIAGNVAMALAQDAILKSAFSDAIKQKAIRRFNDIVKTTNYGQLLDIDITKKQISEVAEQDIITVHSLKTAEYTLTGPLQLGAILAGASDGVSDHVEVSDHVLDALSRISLPLGIAFQIQDDILGIFGTEEKLGKPVYSDVEEGKKTLLVWYAYDHGSEEQKRFISSVFGRKITDERFEKLKNMIIETGALKYSRKRISSLLAESKKELNESVFPAEFKAFISDLSEFLVNREF